MDLWESLLRTTGGAIVVEPGKIDWVKINFVEKNHKMVMAKMNNDEKLFVRNTDGERKQLEQLDVSTARKTLGVMQCVNGDEEEEIKYLLEKIETWKKISGAVFFNTKIYVVRCTQQSGRLSPTHCLLQHSHKNNVPEYHQHF